MVGLSESELEALRWGSYLHDTGKIAIPDSILFKPGPLTREEIALMQTHTLRGEAMLRELGFLPEPVLELVRHHHENWDGQGYPDRLKGEQIPLLARIFSLADVYDALTNIRPYKPAWTHEQACANIAGESGRKFEPELPGLFLELIRKHGR
jgi:HD-GYP domain-containing protein (c-di-GMP phosphodiesterase class II)